MLQYSILVGNCTITWTEKSTVVLLYHNIALVGYCTVGTDWDGWKQVAALLQSSPKPQKFKFQKIDIPWNFHNHLDHQYCEFAMPSTFFLFFYYLHSVFYQHKTVFSEFWLPTYLTITNSSTPPNYLGLQQYTKLSQISQNFASLC